MRRVNDTEVEGMKVLGTFCYNPEAVFPIYFVMRVNKAPESTGYWKMQRDMGVEAQWDSTSGIRKLYTRYNRDIAGDDIGAYFTYSLEEGETVEVQIGVSFVSTENARMNLDAEQNGFDFELQSMERSTVKSYCRRGDRRSAYCLLHRSLSCSYSPKYFE
jgi:putative alpha-1,2-mannosidase